MVCKPKAADKTVYDAEFSFRRILENQYEVPLLKIAGSTVRVSRERKFGDIESAQNYCNLMTKKFNLSPVEVVKGSSDGRYATMGGGVMTLPPFALRESVVLHELAHHYSTVSGHGEMFTAKFVELVHYAMGAEAAFILRVSFYEMGVKVA